MTRVKKKWEGLLGYCTFDPIKCQLSHFEFAVAANFLVLGNLLEAIHFIIRDHLTLKKGLITKGLQLHS